ncbi:MAG TPA: ABC transporter ATP-binding protein [Armatimonadota bacterium]|jgi:ABC-2 type transport system ATP-binding protein
MTFETANAVETFGLTKAYDGHRVVDDLTFTVRRGEFFGFLGPNGAGKSTTIKMLTGLLRPTSGRALVAGYDITTQPLLAKASIGVLPEELNLYERLTGQEFLEFAGRMYGLPGADARNRAAELLHLLQLDEDAGKMIVDYSQGMKKKTALAAAIIHNPPVIFLDEPFEAVDAVSGRIIKDTLHRLTEQGATVFFSSHILEVVERLCSQVAVIQHGRLVAQGNMAELRSRLHTGEDATLEAMFMELVGAAQQTEGLSWLS